MFHIVRPPVAPSWPSIVLVRNPLPTRDGTDPETIEHVRQIAPAAFHAEQFRAVTEADYVKAAAKLSSVSGAVATFRWTGSWHTVFVGVDPRDPADLITEPGGRTRITPRLEHEVRAFLTRYKLAGYDLEIRSAQYVPLDIAMELCVLPEYFRADVVEAVLTALKQLFDPANFTFAQPVYISRLYAAIEVVEGVDSVFFTKFQRFGQLPNGELDTGIMAMGPWEIARLDNDPDFMENGVIRITAGGGK
jgi:predicted phage baseplate assembly protein